MPTLSPAECRAFVLSAPRPAILATVRADGRPHVAPVWIDVETSADGPDTIVFNTGASTVKGRNMARDPRVSLSVDDDRPPFAFVIAEGGAELSDDLDEVTAWAAKLGARYLGADRADEMGRRNGVPGELLVRVRVTRWVGVSQLSD